MRFPGSDRHSIGQNGYAEREKQLNRPLSILAGLLVLILILACGSSDDGSGVADAQLADVSQFPTPTRSRADPQPTAQPETELARVGREDSESGEVEPMSEAEVQQLRQRLQSGDLSEDEARQAFQRLREQFGGGPGGAGDSQAVGSIKSVEESAFTLATELASVSVSVGEDTIIRVTSVVEPTALTDGAQVMVVSERVDGSTLARAITVIPEGQIGFRAGQGGPGGRQGGFGGGQLGPGGARGLFGTVMDVSDTGFTLETQQGPLPIVVDEESVIIETRQGTFTDLEAGMQVRVTGPADENGMIDARTVTVTPAGLEIIGRPGGGS